jgi:hypothetical protein
MHVRGPPSWCLNVVVACRCLASLCCATNAYYALASARAKNEARQALKRVAGSEVRRRVGVAHPRTVVP